MKLTNSYKFSLFIGVENTRILCNFHPLDFTSKSHLRRIILCQGYSTFFFFQTYFRITLYVVYMEVGVLVLVLLVIFCIIISTQSKS
jgi:hypothetical protein